jgi:hypothetical protein
MKIPQLPTSRWFIYVSSSLLVFLCLSVLLAGLILFVQSSQPRAGEVGGSSMEPALQGPRFLATCSVCQTVNQFSIDAWDPKRLASCLCCGSSILTDENVPIQRGETVRYRPTRWSSETAGKTAEGGFRRGDIVVLEREAGSLKELKRVVGLPNEKVALRGGDLWINDQRYAKNLRETLSQGVLIAAWDPRFCEKILDEFIQSVPLPPTNELPINAHDSHILVPTLDFGIALRCSQAIDRGRFDITLDDSENRYDIRVIASRDWTVACNGSPVPRLSSNPNNRSNSPQWLILALIDGRVLVGDDLEACFASSLESVPSRAKDESSMPRKASISISSVEDAPPADLALVFRDLVYRGYRDMPEETILPGPGYVVLGDNVSISDDSRGPEGGAVRWGKEQIKGVVLRESNDLASLLRQSEQWRRSGCGSNEFE